MTDPMSAFPADRSLSPDSLNNSRKRDAARSKSLSPTGKNSSFPPGAVDAGAEGVVVGGSSGAPLEGDSSSSMVQVSTPRGRTYGRFFWGRS